MALELARDRAIKDSKLFTTSLSSMKIEIKSTEKNEKILEEKYKLTSGKYLYLGKHKSIYHVFTPAPEIGDQIPNVFMIPSELVIVGELSRSTR